MANKFTAAVVQLHSGEDPESNRRQAEAWIRQAAAGGAKLVVLPELFTCLGRGEVMSACAEPVPGPTSRWLAQLAAELRVFLLGGSLAEQVAGTAKYYNTSLLFDDRGALRATYRKVHLFDVDVTNQVAYSESQRVEPGDVGRVVPSALGLMGLAICYDLRFPQLFQAYSAYGAEILLVPSAFTQPTGREHWEVLLRARAIENLAYVLAANQVGAHTATWTSYGHSAIVDPWGQVLSEVADEPGIALAEIDLERVARLRRQLPVLAHRRPFRVEVAADGPSSG